MTRQLTTSLLLLALYAVCTAESAQGTPSDGRPLAKIKGSIICCPREKVYLDGWASIDVGGEVVEWQWDLTGNGTPDTVASTGEMVLAAPRESRTYSVILTVRDNSGNLSDPDTATVHVMDIAPTVTLRQDTTVKVGVRVSFRPSIRWVCDEPDHYEWDFDNDGVAEYRSRNNGNTSKVYYTPGRYFAKFRVVDQYGREGGAMTTVNVVGTHLEAERRSDTQTIQN